MRINPKVAQGIMRAGATTCPAAITGKTYLAIGLNAATNVLYAAIYEDGVEATVLNNKDFDSVTCEIVSSTPIRKSVGSGRSVVIGTRKTSAPNRERLATWDCDANTVAENETYSSLVGASLRHIILGSTVYVLVNPGGSGGLVYPITAAVGGSGSLGAGFTAALGLDGSSQPVPFDIDAAGPVHGSVLGIAASGSIAALVGSTDGPGSDDRGFWKWPQGVSAQPDYTWAKTPTDMDPFTDAFPVPGGGAVFIGPGATGGYDQRLWLLPSSLDPDAALNLWPPSWTTGLYGDPQPCPGGQEVVCLFNDGGGAQLVRTLLQQYTDDACAVPGIALDNMTGYGAPPDFFFPLD